MPRLKMPARSDWVAALWIGLVSFSLGIAWDLVYDLVNPSKAFNFLIAAGWK